MRTLVLLLALLVAGCGSIGTKPQLSPAGTGRATAPATLSPSNTPIGPAAVEPSDTPPPGVAGHYAIEFQLKLVGPVTAGDAFHVFFHPPTSDPGHEADFTFCPGDNSPTGPSGPCRAGVTYVEGGGFQPAGSSVSYRFTRVSASGATQVIAQGTAPINMNQALVVVYPQST